MQFEDRVQAIADFGLTRRQARFLVTVMLHSGVCLQRQYAAFAGIVHGQKTRKFFAKLVNRRYGSAYRCRHNRGRIYQVHCKALYRAIGETDSRHRRPLSPARVVRGLMLLDAILADPQLVWLATDAEKAVHLTTLTRIDPDRLPQIGSGKPPSNAGRVAFEKFPIGIDLRGRAVLLYLATDPDVGRFRAVVQRHFELLRSLPAWTLRIVVPPHLEGLADPLLKVAEHELTATVRPDVLKILRWYFIERRNVAGGDYETPNQEEYDDAEEGFKAHRFELLYRRWLTDGDRVFELLSDGLKTAIDSGAGRIERVVLPHSYRHLSPVLTSTVGRTKGAEEGDETCTPSRPRARAPDFTRVSGPSVPVDQVTSTFEAIAR